MLYPTTCVGLRYGFPYDMLSGFSWKHGYLLCQSAPKSEPYCRLSARRVDLPALLTAYGLQRGFPSPRGSVTAPSPRRSQGKSRNINREAIGCAVRLGLRTRLTPG